MSRTSFASIVATSSLVSVTFTVIIVMYALPAYAHAQPTRLTAQEFVLVDDRGTERAHLSVNEQGEARWELMDREGAARIVLGAGAEGGGKLSMVVPGGRTAISMFASGEADEVVGVLMNPEGANNVFLQARRGQGFLLMRGDGGLVSVGSGMFSERESPPSLALLDSHGGRIDARFDERGPSIQLGAGGQTIWSAP